MKQKDNKNEVQTRREFFKKAAKEVLPIISILSISCFPIQLSAESPVNSCKDDCFYVCGGCSRSCYEECEGQCKDGCFRTCTGRCDSTCQGNCKDDCVGNCFKTCQGGCQNSCSGSCSNSCAGSSKI